MTQSMKINGTTFTMSDKTYNDVCEGARLAPQPEIMDLNTAEGCAAWVKELPTENLRTIAARPLDRFNVLIVCAAEGELTLRDLA